MKFFIVILLLASPLWAEESDEFSAITSLILSTEKRLTAEKELKELMHRFKLQRESFLEGEQSKTHVSTMANTARRILEIMTTEHVRHLFSSEYLEELTVFSSVGQRRLLTRP